MPIETGTQAPPVSALNQDGEQVTVDFSRPTVLYFYPKDDTPGCTVESKQFDAELETYQDAGVAAYGISIDDVDAHREFVEKYDLDVTLLADPAREIAEQYGIETSFGGANARTTVVVVDGDIWAVYEAVDPDGHARDVLSALLDAGVVSL